VFNKKNQVEAERKFGDRNSKLAHFGDASHVVIKTANGLGHSAWSRAIGKRLTLDTKKVFNLVKETITKENLRSIDRGDFTAIMQLVSKARTAGIVPKSHSTVRGLLPDDWDSWEQLADQLYLDLNEDLLYVARKCLTECIRQSYQGTIDFDDQIYMSALFGGVFDRYAVLLLDESQDLSPINHLQIKRAAAGRLIVVGDPRQAIYAFRGADSSSMDSLRQLRPDWIDLPLSTTFRCPKILVERQQSHAQGFQAHESNPEGMFLDLSSKEWRLPPGQVAILCRNNAPLFAAALRIIKSGSGCTILGSEIGKGLINVSKKIVPQDSTSLADARVLVLEHFEREIQKAIANQKDSKAEILEDRKDCLLAVLDNIKGSTMGDARRALESMFSKDNLRIVLSTGHKAKGLEWPTVVHLDPWRIPSKWAKEALAAGNSVAYNQDMNLRYVIETRAQETLILANLENFQP